MKKQFFKILALVMLFTLGIGISAYAFTTGYRSFAELAAAEDPSSYTVKTNVVGSNTTILAIHGGGIERGTSEVVKALGGSGKYNTYSFEGLKAADNGSLFIKAINFDEPTAISLVNKSDYTVSVVGAAGDDEVTYIGGQNKLLAELIRLHLTAKGYNVKTLNIQDRIAGVMDSNIVNKNKLFNNSYQLGGVQIAISKGLRDKLATDSGTLNDYSGTINNALSESWPTIVELMKKINNNKSEGFLNRFNPEKRNFDKKIQKVLEKGAKNPKELIQDLKTVSEE
ncbi:poly-gamma-glutamate hydrolase family protein [Desulforamulus ruminis]|uniref:poly-gamma-glutamate hydrolase family protein n=1 Tax=Desulforamulus ruminis TaxID=1564 RepID=UPI002352EB58|nr:poly-gamma-glutamate hydrolase family protein [Desulforamulus ruminis]